MLQSRKIAAILNRIKVLLIWAFWKCSLVPSSSGLVAVKPFEAWCGSNSWKLFRFFEYSCFICSTWLLDLFKICIDTSPEDFKWATDVLLWDEVTKLFPSNSKPLISFCLENWSFSTTSVVFESIMSASSLGVMILVGVFIFWKSENQHKEWYLCSELNLSLNSCT